MMVFFCLVSMAAFVAFIVFGIAWIVAFLRKRPTQKPQRSALISFVVCVVAMILSVATAGDAAETPTETPEPESTVQEAPAETPAPVSYEATPESMQQLFENSFDFEYSELSTSIVEEEGLQVCNVTYHNDAAAWDESAFVRQVLSTFIDFQRLAYDVDGIDAVRFEVWQDMTDDRGNTAPDLCYQFKMTKDACALYDWDAMSGRPILDQMQRDCAEFYIHAGILLKADADDVIYYSNIF